VPPQKDQALPLSKRRPHFKNTYMSTRKKYFSKVSTRPVHKNDCASEAQQQFNWTEPERVHTDKFRNRSTSLQQQVVTSGAQIWLGVNGQEKLWDSQQLDANTKAEVSMVLRAITRQQPVNTARQRRPSACCSTANCKLLKLVKLL
jgi:hypothetical protein